MLGKLHHLDQKFEVFFVYIRGPQLSILFICLAQAKATIVGPFFTTLLFMSSPITTFIETDTSDIFFYFG